MTDLPFDVSHTICDTDLRAVPNDPADMRRAVDWLEEQARDAEDDVARARLLGLAGLYAGILRELERARRLLEEAVDLADREGTSRQRVALRIRLADVHALAHEPDAAVALLEPLVATCDADADLEAVHDFVHQHLGKALLEAGDADGAVAHLERAHDLRERKGDEDLLASTRQALVVARATRARSDP